MPELAEVDTVKTQLNKLTPFKIESVFFSKHYRSIIKKFEHDPVGQTVTAIKRKGKFLDFCLDNGTSIVSHLGMSGGWFISEGISEEKHAHVQLEIKRDPTAIKGWFNEIGNHDRVIIPETDSFFLSYIDPRRFGNMYLLKDKNDKLDELGMDIMDENFTISYFSSIIKENPKAEIKPLLMDQAAFAGIGNYLAAEICAHAKVSPFRVCSQLSVQEITALWEQSIEICKLAIKFNGYSFHGGYHQTDGSKGNVRDFLWVFNQENCVQCGNKVEKVTQATRTTHYCSHCQK